ncbi:MAG: divergent polysaccharide deacetylase family protein [Cognatishimia sp.]
MLRGIIKGLIMGGLLGFALAGVISLISPLPSNIETQTNTDVVVTQPETQPGNEPVRSSEADAPVQLKPKAQAPEPAAPLDNTPLADLTPAPKPAPAPLTDAQAAPQSTSQPSVSVENVSPVLPSPQARAIETPETLSKPSISADPAQPPRPSAPDTTTFGAPVPTDTLIAPKVATETRPATQNVVPESPDTAQDLRAQDATPKLKTAAAELPTVKAPVAAPATAPETPAEAPVVNRAPSDQDTDQDTVETAASRLKPVSDLNQVFKQRTSSRLPSIGETPAVNAPDTPEIAETLPPLQANAATFDNFDAKPLLSIVLLDVPDSDIDLSVLQDFPLPLSIVVDAAAENAAQRMALFRGLNFEVLAMINLPQGATPSDVEVNLTAQVARLPEVVAIFEGLDTGLQETRQVSDQVIDYTLASGHGLLMQPKALNTAQKLAAREGVPSLTIFRDFDGKGQRADVMRRFLDQAAFKARQSNDVVMMGRLRGETISALASWALQDRASTVAVAPVSAILQSVN